MWAQQPPAPPQPEPPSNPALRSRHPRTTWALALALAATLAHAELPTLLQHIPAATTLEAALYRLMDLPGLKVLYPRPPKEAQTQLATLTTNDAELYNLKALADEQALDFPAAARDWQTYANHAADKPHAQLQLADFYHRRVQPTDEIRTLLTVATAPSLAAEAFTPASKQQSWAAFDRIVAVAAAQALDPTVTQHAYDAWLTRYPTEPAVYTLYANWLLDTRQYDATTALIAHYRQAFPADAVFPVKAAALLEVRRGNIARALALYDAGFQPLWPQELLTSYFALLAHTHQERTFISGAKAALARNPDDLNALARVFWYQQQAGRNDAAQLALTQYRLSKETRNASWSATELTTLLTLSERTSAWPEAARYAFALYNLPGDATAQATGLAAMGRILLTAPDQPIPLGQRNLSMFRDIATLDQGPGAWNGILSLWFNDSGIAGEYTAEEQKAQPYFHRAKAAQLLQLLDTKFPTDPHRAALHAQLIAAYAGYGESAAVIDAGAAYLQAFPTADHVPVALQMADAYARQQNTQAEFALYDHLLAELAAQTRNMPLTAAQATASSKPEAAPQTPADLDKQEDPADNPQPSTKPTFTLTAPPTTVAIPAAANYQLILNRYLDRLIAAHQPQAALAVLRHELDRNPNDPPLYERLAQFLEQNDLSAQQEEVYKAAITHFNDPSWSSKLARFYLREKKQQAFADLTRQVTQTFSGTDLEAYFSNAGGLGPQLSLQLNLYAAQRFPHDLVFVHNLLNAYRNRTTRNDTAYNALLRAHWFESDDLRTEFFAYLSRTNQLDAELTALASGNSKLATDNMQPVTANPAALQELAEANLWRSHFEEAAAPFDNLTQLYPADTPLGDRAASVFRSLAYYDPTNTAHSAAIQRNLIAANPSDLGRLATLGDTFADTGAAGTTGHENLAAAAPLWQQMPAVRSGDKDGYLQAATIFWDYFQFEPALQQIAAARNHFHDPTLFGYEAGAIDEGKQALPAAIREYVAAALAGNTEAGERLLELAARDKPTAQLVDSTLASFEGARLQPRHKLSPGPGALAPEGSNGEASPNPSAAMILREQILVAEKRSNELAPLLSSELASATSLDTIAAIADRAKQHDFTAVYNQALQKEITLAADPVQKIELQYELARNLEANHDQPGAARILTAVYAANPRVLGVVRATVDFDWRTGAKPQAITILREAAASARPDLARQFTLEAAAKANDSGNPALARTLLAPLLEAAPFDPQLIHLVAESYANDDAGLRDLYTAKLAAIKTAALTPDARKQTTLLLRRSLIPTLTHSHDYTGATAQYIAMLSAYPEDTGLTDEASLYGLRWQQQPALVDFLNRTVTASPKDSRFAAMLAQVQTTYGDLPAAIDAWTRAVAIRADKPDWFTAKAALELRLNRLDAACADYDRLYALTYKDPQWMVDEARIRAQQGRTADAIDALQKAYLLGPKPTANGNSQIAAQLNQWNLLDDARTFAERGLALSGDTLLVDDPDLAGTYATILTRLRQPEAALTTLTKALAAAKLSSNSPALLAEQVAKTGLASVTDDEWRKKQAAQRASTAQTNFDAALTALAQAVATYDTPEEKQHIATLLTADTTGSDLRRFAGTAGLADIYATYLREQVLKPGDSNSAPIGPYTTFQRGRMAFTELAQKLESYAASLPPRNREQPRRNAAEAYRDAGDEAAELRILTTLQATRTDPTVRDRFLTLLLAHNPQQLVKRAAANDETGFAAANFTLAQAGEPLALEALTARGTTQQPVWNAANRALTGLYFADFSPATDTAFHTTLADDTIADRVDRQPARLAHPADRTQSLAGDPWFYYAARYADFRLAGGPGDPEDFAAAALEHAAGFQEYTALAGTYADAHKLDAALIEYRHALELQPDTASLHDTMAALLWSANHRPEALMEWQTALTILHRQIDLQAVPEDFFLTVPSLATHAHDDGTLPQLKLALTEVLSAYLAKNGTYRSNELLHAAFNASATPAEGVAWLIDLSTAAKPEVQAEVLGQVAGSRWTSDAPWLPAEATAPLLLRQIVLARAHPSQDDPTPHLQSDLVLLYTQQHQDAAANAMLAELPAAQRDGPTLIVPRIELAARANTLPALLASFDDSATDSEDNLTNIAAAATTLAAAGDLPHAREVHEWLFTRALLRHTLVPTDYLALAELRLQTSDTPGALDLLHRLTLLPADNPADTYTNDDLAAALLEHNSHEAEAIPFLQTLAASAPWDATYTLRLAEVQLHANQSPEAARKTLTRLAANPLTPYDLRTQAAAALHSSTPTTLGSKELDLLASNPTTNLGAPHPDSGTWAATTLKAAQQPYFFQSRIAAATATTDSTQRVQLLREALAIAPTTPQTDTLRTAIFRAEAALHHDATALAAIQPLLTTLQPNSNEDDTSNLTPLQTPSPAAADIAHAQLLAEVSAVAWHLNPNAEALQYLATALAIDPKNAAWQRTLTAHRATLRHEQQNVLRRPILQAELTQPNPVRPRLTTPQEAK